MTLPAEEMFTPELGQALITNTPWHRSELSQLQSADLHELAEVIGRHRGDYQRGWGALTTNSGAEEYTSEVFDMRCFCWCDGDDPGHSGECPPNFHHHPSGLKVSWYKHAGRGASISRQVSTTEWKHIIAQCRASIPYTDDELDAARHLDKTVCRVCALSTEDRSVTHTAQDVDCIERAGLCATCQQAEWDQMDQLMHQMDQDGTVTTVELNFGTDHA